MPWQSLTALYEQQLERELERFRSENSVGLPSTAELFSSARFSARRSKGDEILEMLNTTLDSFKPHRAAHQVIFHRHFLLSCLPKIYGEEWEQMAPTVLARMGLREIKQETLVVTPRRYGKTISVAMFCAAMIYCVPDLEIGIFSTGKRAAGKLMDKTWQFFMQLDGWRDMVVKKNAETAEIRDPRIPGDKRVLSSYPGTTKVRQLASKLPRRGDGTLFPPPAKVSVCFLLSLKNVCRVDAMRRSTRAVRLCQSDCAAPL